MDTHGGFEGVLRRLDRVERQNRRLKVGVTSLAVLVCAGVLMAVAAPAPKTVVAEKFIVRDAENNSWAELANYGKDGTALILRDKTGARALILGVTPGGESELQLREKDRGRVSLSLVPGGAAGIEIKDVARENRLTLGYRPRKGSAVEMRDTKGNQRVTLGCWDDGTAGLQVRNADGETAFQAPK